MLKTNDFDYILPKELIAQSPAAKRVDSRLLVYESAVNRVTHSHFRDLRDFLRSGDVLVVNTSKVIPARIIFGADGKELEIFLLKRCDEDIFRTMVRPGKKFPVGACFNANGLGCEVLEVLDDGTRLIKFDSDPLEFGEVPLPPYIQNDEKGVFDRYQTVYANEPGSVAAPTAGLHFSETLISELEHSGVEFVEVNLHVGRGTFLPVKSANIADHEMHFEEYSLSEAAAARLNAAKTEGRRIIAVGTTSVRVLESCFNDGFVAQTGDTDIFIYPGYDWKAVDGLITNFHLPKSTLMMLVSSFIAYKGADDEVAKLLEIYRLAIEESYRFYSFGDACLFL